MPTDAPTGIKVFEVSDEEWIAAENAESAAAYYRHLVSDATYAEVLEEFGEPQEVHPERLARLRFNDDEQSPPRTITFAERLAELMADDKNVYPQFFATGNF